MTEDELREGAERLTLPVSVTQRARLFAAGGVPARARSMPNLELAARATVEANP